MIYHSHAPSRAAEEILQIYHRKTIIPAPDTAFQDSRRLDLHLRSNDVARRFNIGEIVKPHKASAAKSVGYTELCPPAHTWGVVALLMWIADELREASGAPVNLRNLWRPQSYNALVAESGIDSDHPNACGMDLDFKGPSEREKALEWLIEWVTTSDNAAQVSVGLGGRTLHVGVLTPRGTRHWTYDSWGGRPVPAVFTRLRWMNRP
jgi:hypothetical protein